ncbi:hypothetical protein MAR_025994, partial [Mya arenaria]
ASKHLPIDCLCHNLAFIWIHKTAEMATGLEIDHEPRKTSGGVGKLLCLHCMQVVPRYFCLECEVYLCDTCKTQHDKDRLKCKHTYVTTYSQNRIIGSDMRAPKQGDIDNPKSVKMDESIADGPVSSKKRSLSSTEEEILASSCDAPETSRTSVVMSSVRILTTKTENDVKNTTEIGCLKLLRDDLVVVTDIENKRLKCFVYSLDDLFLVESLVFKTAPWCVSSVDDSKLIVTLPDAKCYQELHLDGSCLRRGNIIKLGGHFPVCAVTKSGIVFADTDNAHFIMTDLSGQHVTDLFDNDIEKRFETPNFLLYNDRNDMLLINDPVKGVFGFDMTYKSWIFRFSNPSLVCPLEFIVAENEDIFILGNESKNIHVISLNGEFKYEISLRDVNTQQGPCCICYHPKLDAYLISLSGSYDLLQFKLNI